MLFQFCLRKRNYIGQMAKQPAIRDGYELRISELSKVPHSVAELKRAMQEQQHSSGDSSTTSNLGSQYQYHHSVS